jgi:hypothetical protein
VVTAGERENLAAVFFIVSGLYRRGGLAKTSFLASVMLPSRFKAWSYLSLPESVTWGHAGSMLGALPLVALGKGTRVRVRYVVRTAAL